MKKTTEIDFSQLKKDISKYIKNKKKIQLIEKVYLFAKEKHHGVQRLTGEDYIHHPLHVANILITINADAETIAAAILHDVLEDTDTEANELKENFGEEITELVVSLTKINKLNFRLESQAANANYRKIIVGLSKDVRVIIIKLADRLHNMRTLWVLPEKQQKETAKETLDILIPIAHRLGINQIKSELEDLSLRYLKPDVYFSIVETLNKTKKDRDIAVEEMMLNVSELLRKHQIKNKVKGRAKSIFSIYQKLDKGREFRDIYDLMALRIFVDTESDCYQALGIIHSKYRPIPKRFKDFIAMPKTNMYQSLHTTVFGDKGNVFEIQIRTYKMDEVAEKGIASHWGYKEGGSKLQSTLEEKLQFYRSIIELKTSNVDDDDFVSSVKQDVFDETIYVFTPKGDVIELPNGATPIDFAYKVHSQVGEKMVSAIVNNNIVPLDYQLKNQDIIKVNTNPNSLGPSREWINMVKTAQAKNKIKAFFAKADKEKYYENGEELLSKELRTQKVTNQSFFADENISQVLKHYKLTNLEELYIAIGSKKISVKEVVARDYLDSNKKEEVVFKKITNEDQVKNVSRNEIIVEGMDDLKVNIAKCCQPIFGDEIIGYITKGHGITVHRLNCPNSNNCKERTVDVRWNKQEDKKYLTNLIIYANHDQNLLLDIMAKTANFDLHVKHFNDLEKKDDYVFEIVLLVSEKTALDKFIQSLENIKEIDRVERVIR